MGFENLYGWCVLENAGFVLYCGEAIRFGDGAKSDFRMLAFLDGDEEMNMLLFIL